MESKYKKIYKAILSLKKDEKREIKEGTPSDVMQFLYLLQRVGVCEIKDYKITLPDNPAHREITLKQAKFLTKEGILTGGKICKGAVIIFEDSGLIMRVVDAGKVGEFAKAIDGKVEELQNQKVLILNYPYINLETNG